ncbi:hypothetical protein BUE80_DR001900 [Diplocarpon rosae]|nr:hypothetical protein BUE80_DR001900 [Diplocarpon rosae]
MDVFYMEPGVQDSRQCSTKSNGYLPSTAAPFQASDFPENSSTTEPPAGPPPSGILPVRSTSSQGYHLDQGSSSHPSPEPSSITAPVPQQYSLLSRLSDSNVNANWSYLHEREEHAGSAPVPGLGSAPSPPNDDDQQQPPQPQQSSGENKPTRSHSNSAAMSTLGIESYDSRFDAEMHTGLRQNYTWPIFEMNDQFVPQHQSLGQEQSTHFLYDEPKLLPMYSRSLTSSPQPNFTAEQRDLKRQRDYTRREAKSRMRRERSTSRPNSSRSSLYLGSQHNSPDMMPRSVPEYTSNLTPSPLLSQASLQSSPGLCSSPFLPPYSPPLSDHVSSDLYGPVFTMGPNDYTSVPAYHLPFSDAGCEPGIQSFTGRPHSHPLPSVPDHASSLYQTPQMSPKLGLADAGDHVRVVHSRPKPQCWEHGCNGRQFSTFSNLLRHQREKSGVSQKSSCPNCGAEFTRTTARNGHMAHDKCKSRRNT